MNNINTTPLIIGSIYGALSVILGAFAAHALKKKMKPSLLSSFETGVKYQMYHALLLIMLGFMPQNDRLTNITNIICIGVFLFSFSIYGLALSATFSKKIKILGPITPIGGLCLVAGWCMLAYYFMTL